MIVEIRARRSGRCEAICAILALVAAADLTSKLAVALPSPPIASAVAGELVVASVVLAVTDAVPTAPFPPLPAKVELPPLPPRLVTVPLTEPLAVGEMVAVPGAPAVPVFALPP